MFQAPINNNEDFYALVERRYRWSRDIKAGTTVLKPEHAQVRRI